VQKIDEFSPILPPENLEQNSLNSLIRYARIYFDESATEEMLSEWRPLLCPFDMSMNKCFERSKLFLPTILYEYQMEKGYR
jgi:proteasome activator subunit 4